MRFFDSTKIRNLKQMDAFSIENPGLQEGLENKLKTEVAFEREEHSFEKFIEPK